MLDRIIIFPRHIRPFLNRERRRAKGVILDGDGILACGASARGASARGASNSIISRTGARI